MENIKKIGAIAGVVTILTTIILYIYSLGEKDASYEGRIFTSPEEKVFTVGKVKEMPSSKDVWKKYIRDSMYKEQTKASRKMRDSLWIEMNKTLKHQDSINQLNADQMYQIKEQLKNLNR